MRLVFSTVLLMACGDAGLTAFSEQAGTLGTAELEIDPQGKIVFADVGADSGVDYQQVELRSTGDGIVSVIDMYLDPMTSSAFALPDDLPLPIRLDPGEDFPVEVSFAPYAVGSFAGTLVVEVELDGESVERLRDLDGSGI